MKTKIFTVSFIALALTLIGCNTSTKNSENETDKTDTLLLTKQSEEPIRQTDYNQYPIAYIKIDGKLYFFNPEDQSIVQFKEETDSVFNCVYSDMDAMFYYSTYKSGVLTIKKVDLSVLPIQISQVTELKKPEEELYNQTDYSRAQLRFTNNHLLLEHDFIWDSYSYSKFIDISLADNSTSIFDQWELEDRYTGQDVTPEVEMAMKNFDAVCEKAKQLDLSKYKTDPNYVVETEYYFEGASYDGQKILFTILTEFGDLGHGPYCVANADGTMLKLIDKDISDPQKPIWSNHNVVFLNTRRIGNKEDYNYITELFYTLADTFEIEVIDENVNYFSVRKKHPVN